MIRINLLPTEQRTKTRQVKLPRVGNVALLGAVGGVIAVLLVTFLVQQVRARGLKSKIAEAKTQAAQLGPQIEQIEKLTAERRELDTHLKVIRELEKGRTFEVMLLDELNKRVPDHLWLTSYSRTDSASVALDGVTFSNLIVADLMTRLERSVLYENVDLTIAERGVIEERDVVRFSLTSKVKPE
ncbi:MAG: PilN domain-containing protein [Candidatus Eisenbacteria bacterium]|nr:PilN domain-containing protein [Candidatus Eisenbacteria bacterium]